MQVSNNYDKNIFNGDKGVVKMVLGKTGRVLVDYDGIPVEYGKKEFDQLKHSFAITVHKSQGDQFPVVIIPITNYHSVLLNRNLLYTAMTRAKHKLIFVGDREALEYAIRNLQGLKRNTALCERLKQSLQKAAYGKRRFGGAFFVFTHKKSAKINSIMAEKQSYFFAEFIPL